MKQKNRALQFFSLSALTNFSAIFICPNICHADAINPLINLFTPDTAISASILTAIIIFIEAILLRRWIKPVSFRVSLWRSAIINFASSAAGSLVVLLFFKDELFWGMAGLVVPMFILTLITETPLLKIFYRMQGLSWFRSAKISFGINLISYLFVFVSQIILIFAYLYYAGFADEQTLKKWTDISLLNNESGYIYTTEYVSSENFSRSIIKRYDVEAKKWEIIDPGVERGIDPVVWDMRDNILTSIIETDDREYRSLSIFDTSSNTLIAQIKGAFNEVRISPDLKKVAALEYVKNAVAPKDEEGYFMLGSACRLRIYDTKSGTLLYEAPRLALADGLSWNKESTTVFFASLQQEHLFDNKADNYPSSSYGRSYAKQGQFPIDIFAFDIASNTVRRIVEGTDLGIIAATNEITFLREKGMYKKELWRLDPKTNTSSLVLEEMKGYHHAVSPSGMKYLIPVPHKKPFGQSNFLTVIDSKDVSRRFILLPSSRYDFRWVAKTNE